MRLAIELAMVAVGFWLLGAACAMNVADFPRSVFAPALIGAAIGIPALVFGGISGLIWLR